MICPKIRCRIFVFRRWSLYCYYYLGQHVEEKEKTVQVSCSYTPVGPMETVLFYQHNFYFLNKGIEGKCWYSAPPPLFGHRPYDVQGFLRVHRFLCMGKGAHLYPGIEWLHGDSHAQQSLTLEKMCILSEGCLSWRMSSFHYDGESCLPCHPGNGWF